MSTTEHDNRNIFRSKTQTDNAKSLNSRKSKCTRKLCHLYDFIYNVVDMRIGRFYEPKHESSSPQTVGKHFSTLIVLHESSNPFELGVEQALYVGRRHRIRGDSVETLPWKGVAALAPRSVHYHWAKPSEMKPSFPSTKIIL